MNHTDTDTTTPVLRCNDHPGECPDDITGKPATAEQIEAAKAAEPEGGLFLIDATDGEVLSPGSFAAQSAKAAGTVAIVWVDDDA